MRRYSPTHPQLPMIAAVIAGAFAGLATIGLATETAEAATPPHGPEAQAASSTGARAVASRKRRCTRRKKAGAPRRGCKTAEGKGARRYRKPKGSTGGAVTNDQFLPFDNGFRVRVSQGNGGAESHWRNSTYHAWDFAAAPGVTVRAATTGKVLKVQTGCFIQSNRYNDCGGGWGNHVVVQLGDGTCQRYGHLRTVNAGIAVGAAVPRYTVLGVVGSTGASDGPHLHFQRERCAASTQTLGSTFVEVGVPREGVVVTSQNGPEAPTPPVSVNPQVTGNPQGGTYDPQQASTITIPTVNPQQPPAQGGGGNPSPAPVIGFTISDSYLGGTWARTDPDNGPWYSKGNRPGNGAYWYPNGLGVAVDCARAAASYTVTFAGGRKETWNTWFHVTDGKWFPSAAANETQVNGFYGLAGC